MGRHRRSTSGRPRHRHSRRYPDRHPRRTGRGAHPARAGNPHTAARRAPSWPRAQAQRILDQQPAPTAADDPSYGRRTPPCPGDNQRGDRDRRSPGDCRGCRRRPRATAGIRQRHPCRRRRRRRPQRAAVCGRPPGKPSRWPSPRRWPSSSASWCRPSRWYWAVIAAFVIFAGTNSWGETLTKGWQRLLGTMLGVPCGVLVATLFSGNTTASLAAIFVCLFCAFYFMTVTYSLMTFWITTMLALLYGLLGQFSFGVLMLRIEETAIGAVIGVTVAILVLPTNTRTAIRNDTRAFLTSLSALIEISTATMFGGDETASPTEQARELDRNLQQFRVTAKPLLAGVAGLAGRRSIRRGLRLFTACDRYGRSLARSSRAVPGTRRVRTAGLRTNHSVHVGRSADAEQHRRAGRHHRRRRDGDRQLRDRCPRRRGDPGPASGRRGRTESRYPTIPHRGARASPDRTGRRHRGDQSRRARQL